MMASFHTACPGAGGWGLGAATRVQGSSSGWWDAKSTAVRAAQLCACDKEHEPHT